MKNKKICKILAIIILSIFTISLLNGTVYAAAHSATEIIDDAGGGGSTSNDNFEIKSYDSNGADSTVTAPINTITGIIVSVMRIIAVGVAMVMLTVLAIKYMSAAPSERAEIKKSAVQYVIGAVVLFGCYGILTIIQNFTSTALPTN